MILRCLGINSRVMYSLKTNPGDMFKINEKSGLLQLAKELDREKTPTYTVTIVAKDWVSVFHYIEEAKMLKKFQFKHLSFRLNFL